MEWIQSKDNSIFKKLKKLKQKKYREEYNLFLAEGFKFLQFNITPEYIILKSSFEKKLSQMIEEKMGSSFFENNKIIVLEEKLFNELTSQENSQGIILAYKIKNNNIRPSNNILVILDRITDPGNMGTILRLCDSVGFKDLILVHGSVDVYNEKVVRSTMGSIFEVNFNYWTEKETIDFIKKENYQINVTTLSSDSVSYNKLVLSKKNAIIFGSEGDGVSQSFLEIADKKINIPIYGSAESLNVGVASGIILYKVREILENDEKL